VAALWSFNISGTGARCSPAVDNKICQETPASATVNRMLVAGRDLQQTLPKVAWRTILKRHLLKGTFGSEMHLIS
jgi:hypothetical protein